MKASLYKYIEILWKDSIECVSGLKAEIYENHAENVSAWYGAYSPRGAIGVSSLI